jgi:hypothetical protein
VSEPRILQCSSCGAPIQFGAPFCVYCRSPLTWGAVPLLARGRLIARLDGAKDALDKREVQLLERRTDGTVVTVGPRRAANGAVGLRRRHGCIVIEAVALDAHATIGVAARQQELVSSGGYSLAVIPYFRTVDLAKVLASKTHLYSHGLCEWEFHESVRRVGEVNEVELRLADSIIQVFVNGQHVSSSIDATFGFGMFGWRIQSLADLPARALIRSVSLHEVA